MDTNQQEKILIWKRDDESTQTIEVLKFNNTKAGFQIKSLVSGILNNRPILIEYHIIIDQKWKVKEISLISLLTKDKLVLKSGLNERWYDEKNNEIAELKGCIDIDISLSPITNTLPIKRLGDSLIKRTKITVLYINLTNWKHEKVEQYYTKISNNLYKYEGVFRNFEADLPVDNFGFVMTYPTLFKRVFPMS
ncbi:putative glycolipid-binding domain-containing protein [Pontibacter arcticus]|uniref:Uncharacterized protein n=1 Tax=Pontibacter arcticus TaxID=2080288 RepID=A0A364RDH2_9BACT|nr:putative glycolipid-binding domain-containing protein [Pontibacter arcticus]RAU82295.1 hypothetical protein DP923_10925 [Pontibacter arcticus]